MLKFSPLMPPVMFTSSLHSRANIEKDDAVQCEVASSNGQFKVIVDSCQCNFGVACSTCHVDTYLLFLNIGSLQR